MAFDNKKYLDLVGLQSFWTKAKEFIADHYDVKGAADDVKTELLGEAETYTTFKKVEDALKTMASDTTVSELQNRVTGVEGILNGTEATQGLVKDVEDLAGRMDTAEGEIEALQEALNGVEGNGGLTARVKALEDEFEDEGRVGVAEVAIDALRTDLGVNDKTDTTAFARIAELEKSLEGEDGNSGLTARVDAAEDAIDALRVDLGTKQESEAAAFARIEALEAATGTGEDGILAQAKDYADSLASNYDAVGSAQAAQNAAITASKVTIVPGDGNGTDVLKTYKFYQGIDEDQKPIEIGTIELDIAKDLVVTGGEIVEKDGEKYLSLTIANSNDKVEINVKDLVDVYTGSAEKFINITSGNVVELKVDELDAYLAAEGSTVGDAIKANADAIAEIDKVINGEEGGAAGILAQAKDYADSLASNYDAVGSAQAAYDAMVAYTAQEVADAFDSWNTEA